MDEPAATQSAGEGESSWTRWHRLGGAIVISAGALVLYGVGTAGGGYTGDLDQVLQASRAVLDGLDPYSPEVASWVEDWGFPLYYPLPTLLAALPLALLPIHLARVVFVGLSTFLLAWAVTRAGPHRLWIFASGAYLGALASTQWSPLLTASLLLPMLAPVMVAKPNIGAAFMLSGPGRRFVLAGLIGGGILVAASFVYDPGWVPKWLAALQGAPHFTPPVLLPGGAIVLLALLKWRRWDARLLVAMACMPHTTMVYEALPILLVAKGWKQTLLLSILSLVALAGQFMLDSRISGSEVMALEAFAEWTRGVGMLSVALIYLPATIMILRRVNERAGPV